MKRFLDVVKIQLCSFHSLYNMFFSADRTQQLLDIIVSMFVN
jgi:hypothetical protein